MKNAILTVATTLTLLFCFVSSTTAQIRVIWKGGTPGQETNWNCYKNWSNYRVPDAFSDVVIPNVSSTTFAAPVITFGVFEVNSIQIQPNASLTVEQGAQLVVYSMENEFEKEEGLHLKGPLVILDNAIAGTPNTGIAQTRKPARLKNELPSFIEGN